MKSGQTKQMSQDGLGMLSNLAGKEKKTATLENDDPLTGSGSGSGGFPTGVAVAAALSQLVPHTLTKAASTGLLDTMTSMNMINMNIGLTPLGLQRSASMERMALGSAMGSAMGPPLRAQLSQSMQSGMPTNEWRGASTIEERGGVRDKIRKAFKRNCNDYEHMVDVATAVCEELLFAVSNTRLEYFRASIQFDNRLSLKRKELEGQSPFDTYLREQEQKAAVGSAGAVTAVKDSASSGLPSARRDRTAPIIEAGCTVRASAASVSSTKIREAAAEAAAIAVEHHVATAAKVPSATTPTTKDKTTGGGANKKPKLEG